MISLFKKAVSLVILPFKLLGLILAYPLGLNEKGSLRVPHVLFRLFVLCLMAFLVWANFFKIDQVVHAAGQVVASAHTQIVQAADGGVLVELKVQEGDPVKAGQLIAVLEKERALAAFTQSQGKVTALRMTIQRLQAEIAGTPLSYSAALQSQYKDLVSSQMNLYGQRRKTLQAQLNVLQDNIRLANEELAMNAPLEKLGDVSKTDILRLKRSLNETQTQYTGLKSKYLQDASAELNKAQEDLNAEEQTMSDREQLLTHTNIFAPVAGIVKTVRITTLGGVVRQGDELLQILPSEGGLVIEAKVKPADMANVKVGMPVRVKLDAFDYSIFGTMSGNVTYVSADALTEESKLGQTTYYRVKVSIADNNFKGKKASLIEVRPGMTAAIDIQSGSRSVISYLLKPVTKTFAESLGER